MVKAAGTWLGVLSTQEAGAPNRDDSSQAQNRKIWRGVQTVSDGLDSTNIPQGSAWIDRPPANSANHAP